MTNNGTFTHNGGILNLNSPQVVPGGNYFYLKLTGTSGEYKFSGNATINNNLVIGSGTTVNDSGKTITVLRDVTNDGTLKGSGKLKLTASSVYQTMSGNGVYGNIEVATATTSGIRFVNSSTITKLLQLTSGTVIVYTNTTLTVGSNSTSTGNITFASGTQILGSSSSSTSALQVLGNSSAPAITGFNFSSGGSLTINRPNGVTLGALCKVGATLTVTAGKLRMNGNNLFVGQSNSSNGFIVTSGTGKISNSSTTAGYMYVYGTSSSAAQITGLLIDSMYNVYVTYPLGVSIGNSFRVSGVLNISKGSLDLNGYTITLSSTASVSESKNNLIYGTTGFITTTRSYTSALSSNNIAGLGLVVTSNQSMGNTTIVRGHTLSQQNSQNSVRRYFTLQPSNYTGLVYNTIEFRYDSLECGTGLTTPSRHVIAKNTTAGATTGWTRVAGASRAPSLGGSYGYQWVVSKNVAGAATQVFTVFDSVSASLTPSVFTQPVATSNEVVEMSEVKVWPNPFNKDLNIGFDVNEDVTMTITMMDMSGKTVSSQVVKAQKGYNTLSFNNAELPAGMYLINMIQNNEVKTIRVVKTN
ncbi:MAG: T9SS type A sorting domain-containing protein [Bacteroidetes bacterium]|nr:T9SS type A sorting domain-containing protein [Bacteroidota bacterium]